LAKPVETATLLAVLCSFLFRLLAIVFKWQTHSIATPPAEPEPDTPRPQDHAS
jgi:hypothetical protein